MSTLEIILFAAAAVAAFAALLGLADLYSNYVAPKYGLTPFTWVDVITLIIGAAVAYIGILLS